MSDGRPPPEPGTRCRYCGIREATEWWEWSPGTSWEPWCEICMLCQQIPFMREIAERLGAREARFHELVGCSFNEREVQWRAAELIVPGPGVYPTKEGEAVVAKEVVVTSGGGDTPVEDEQRSEES